MHFAAHGDPDIKAAHALATDGICQPSRPSLQAILGTKLLNEDNDPIWQPWSRQFSLLLANYQKMGGSPLAGHCPKSWPSHPVGFCMHELTPPLRYWSMRSFVSRMKVDNVIQRADGSTAVDSAVQPLWNYVITSRGEILVGAEDFGWIKHTSVAAGQKVWAAGQVGLENGKLRLVDLQSGHYVLAGSANITPGSTLARELIAFTESVIIAYFALFGLPNLHPSFGCIWG